MPYRRAIAAGVAPVVMISNAAYAAYGPAPAAWSPRVLSELRKQGFDGVTVTDALEPLATTHGVTLEQAAIRAAPAGVDLLLLRRLGELDGACLRRAAGRGACSALPRAALEWSAARINQLAATYAG